MLLFSSSRAHMLPVAVHAAGVGGGGEDCGVSVVPIILSSYQVLQLTPPPPPPPPSSSALQQVWLLHQRAAAAHRSLNNSSGSDLRSDLISAPICLQLRTTTTQFTLYFIRFSVRLQLINTVCVCVCGGWQLHVGKVFYRLQHLPLGGGEEEGCWPTPSLLRL